MDLTVDEAVHLAHALAAHLAESQGVRALFIKGPTAHAQGIRERRVSSDVDVIVHPLDVDAFVTALTGHGWRVRPERFAPRAYPVHSITLFHPRWPCDIDVHDRYPGFFADPERVFDVLWEARESVEIAHRGVTVPSPMAGAIIVALHALKDPLLARSASEARGVIALLGSLDEPSRDDLIRLVERTRSVYPLRTILDAVNIRATDDLTAAERRIWELRVAGTGRSSYHWALALAEASAMRKLGLVFSALATALALRQDPAETAPLSTSGVESTAARRSWKEALDFVRLVRSLSTDAARRNRNARTKS
ncbi:nucleotidyltransferase family protein [Rathayibacter sp. SD072]|uniref:nucleotidyltransferase family protein n=1 Tax=Rathayibacter sp. SD072 TaxID=2781731 RepID=UPI001A971E8C|nr:nucleotidyltransferase family protein [Rathayibacter sp. SD072]MBO0982886.1 nucleotidyltransferase family protein [Rathayibacter sp. SD072]